MCWRNNEKTGEPRETPQKSGHCPPQVLAADKVKMECVGGIMEKWENRENTPKNPDLVHHKYYHGDIVI